MTVSVVIPVYNVKPYLERCVQSVLRQTYTDIEILLVDDGSTDGSGQLCDQIATLDKRIRVIHQQNQGLSGARNTGIRLAIGEYIFFLDSDDEWLLHDGLAQLIQKMPPSCDAVIFKSVDIWSNANLTHNADYPVDYLNSLPNTQEVFTTLILSQKFRMSACFLMVRRLILINHNIFFPLGYISEDVPWSLQLWQHINTVTFTNLELYGYYHRAESLSTSVTLPSYESYDKIFSDWKIQCDKGCVNASAIRIYLANLWVSRGYSFHELKAVDKPAALAILERHADLLQYAATPKSRRTRTMVKRLGVKQTLSVLGFYWQLRSWVKGYVV